MMHMEECEWVRAVWVSDFDRIKIVSFLNINMICGEARVGMV